MKLIDIAQNIDKSEGNESWVDTEEIGNILNLNIPHITQSELKAYWVGNWRCTDTYVGYRMYFLGDEPVAFTTQTGRKSDEHFNWFSKEAAVKVATYLLSFLLEPDYGPELNTVDINDDVGESFTISFNEEIVRKEHVTYKGEKVLLVERIKNKDYGMDDIQKIQLPNGETLEVRVEELDFGFHVL